MPCYEPPPPFEKEKDESAIKAVKILCRLVRLNLDAGVAVPNDILCWYYEHRKIDLMVAKESLLWAGENTVIAEIKANIAEIEADIERIHDKLVAADFKR